MYLKATASAISPAANDVRRHVTEMAIEIAVIGAVAELAVGHEAEAEAVLQLHSFGDRNVFRSRQGFGIGFAVGDLPAQLQKSHWAKQATDVVGAERRRLQHTSAPRRGLTTKSLAGQ
jgi:hypothetical protein